MKEFLRALGPTRWAMLAGAVALLIVAILTLSYCSDRERLKRADGKASVATSQSGLGADAMKRADELGTANRDGQAITDANTNHITGADNADQDAGDAGNRGRLAYCERQRLRHKPEPGYCSELRRAYPSVAP